MRRSTLNFENPWPAVIVKDCIFHETHMNVTKAKTCQHRNMINLKFPPNVNVCARYTSMQYGRTRGWFMKRREYVDGLQTVRYDIFRLSFLYFNAYRTHATCCCGISLKLLLLITASVTNDVSCRTFQPHRKLRSRNRQPGFFRAVGLIKICN